MCGGGVTVDGQQTGRACTQTTHCFSGCFWWFIVVRSKVFVEQNIQNCDLLSMLDLMMIKFCLLTSLWQYSWIYIYASEEYLRQLSVALSAYSVFHIVEPRRCMTSMKMTRIDIVISWISVCLMKKMHESMIIAINCTYVKLDGQTADRSRFLWVGSCVTIAISSLNLPRWPLGIFHLCQIHKAPTPDNVYFCWELFEPQTRTYLLRHTEIDLINPINNNDTIAYMSGECLRLCVVSPQFAYEHTCYRVSP